MQVLGLSVELGGGGGALVTAGARAVEARWRGVCRAVLRLVATSGDTPLVVRGKTKERGGGGGGGERRRGDREGE